MHKSGLVELEAVLAVARRRGFRPAAVELGMSTSALSSAVAGLEARLGVRLFHRTTRSVSLTEAGEQFVARVGPALSEIRSATAAAASQRQRPAGTLRINAALGAARMVFAPLVVEYLRRYPLQSLLDAVDASDFAVAIAHADDTASIRGQQWSVPRDNVVFELGLFMGRLGKDRAVLMESRDHGVKLPSDLTGITTIPYRYQPGGDIAALMAPACNQLRDHILRFGPNL